MRVRRLIGILDMCSQIVYEDDKVVAFLDKFPLVTFRMHLHAPSNKNKKPACTFKQK
jgi:hypothetical protein